MGVERGSCVVICDGLHCERELVLPAGVDPVAAAAGDDGWSVRNGQLLCRECSAAPRPWLS